MSTALEAREAVHQIQRTASWTDRVGVTIVTYNGQDVIHPCLDSLARAGLPPRSVVVVDNASTDGTRELVRSACPDVRLLMSDRNLGYGAAVNLGARASDAEYVLVLNQDLVVEAGAIQALIDALDADPTVALANAKVVLASDPGRVNACGNTMHYTGITVCRGFNEPSASYAADEPLQVISGAAFLARRSVFEQLGGFDPRFFLYLEDTDLSLRLARAGFRAVLASGAVVRHQFVPKFAPEKLFWLERNRYMMLVKNFEWRVLFAVAPALLLAECVVWGFAVLRGPTSLVAKLRAYRWLVVNRHALLQDRRRLARQHRVLGVAFLDDCSRDLDLAEITHPLATLGLLVLNPLFRGWYALARWLLTR
ncbi:MAG: glycosyltransferase family 2 protein [Chloroflexota bacterium]